MKRTVFLVGLLAVAAFAAGNATSPFKSMKALRAKQVYQKASQRAEAAYKQAVAEAADTYARVLQGEITAATKAGQLDEALALREEAETVAEKMKSGKPATIDGLWVVRFSNKAVRWYAFKGSRAACADVTKQCTEGVVKSRGPRAVVRFGDGKEDEIAMKGDRIAVEHRQIATGKVVATGDGLLIAR